MRNWTKGKRLTAAFLAVALFLSIIPSGVIPVYSEESTSQAVDYSQYIGYLAELNFKDHISFTAAQTPNGASTTVVATDFVNMVKLQIVDCHVDGSSLWFQVTAAPGYTLPAKLETYPWILQNTIGTAGTADALILTKPTYSDAAASVLNDNGVTVSGDLVELTALTVQESRFAPVASYISRSASYNISTQTASGYYSGHATVAIPIPAGWDSAKIFGFVVENDNSVSMIPGTVTEYGTFRFTVPHFSVIGIAEVTDPALVQNLVITFGRIQETNTVTIEKKIGAEGRYTSDDGAIEYVIQHVHSTDPDSTKTKITFKGLSVANTNVVIENYTFTVIVNKAEVQVEKLLASGAAASEMLYPLYDLGVTGPYSVTYDVLTSGCVDLNTTSGVIALKSGFEGVGNATVVARVTHTVNRETTEVATVTYKVMATGVAVNDVKHLYVPQNGTVTITKYVGSLVTENLLDTNIATVDMIVNADNAVTGIKVTGVANSGETYFVADSGTQKVLFVVHAEPENTNKSNQCYLWVVIESNTHCTIYYAINGGTLHCLPASTAYHNSTEDQNRVVLVGLDISTVQEIPGNYTITFFGAPDPGYTTAKISVKNSEGQFYCLSNGILYDGSDSDAWPLDAMGHQKTDKFNKPHGMYNPIHHGHMTEAELRDLYTRALALGCDSVSSFTRLGTDDFRTNISFIAEKLPSFEKKITHFYNPVSGEWKKYTEDVVLAIGYVVRYQFRVDITSEYSTYQLTIADPYLTANGGVLTGAGLAIGDLTIGDTVIGNHVIGSTETTLANMTGTVVSNSANYASLTFTNVTETLSFTVEYTLNDNDILLYANGQFTNHATLSYTYDSLAASGSNQAETTASAACRVSSIVTWVDSFGKVIIVKEVEHGEYVTHPTNLEGYTAYTFKSWNVGETELKDESYKVEYGGEKNITIVAKYEAIEYGITYLLGEGASWPQDANVPEKYTYEDIITLPVPVRNGYTFKGWKIDATSEGSQGNWPVGIDCTGEFLLLQMYGDVTLTAVWEANSYNIEFDLNDGNWPTDAWPEGSNPPEKYTVGEKLELPEPVLPGHVFLMWMVLPKTEGTEFGKISFDPVNFYGDVTLKAIWVDGITSLTIKVDAMTPPNETTGVRGMIDPQQTFLFTITGGGVNLEVAVPAGGSVTIEGLYIDTQYTVTLQTSWSWRYEINSASFVAGSAPMAGGPMAGDPSTVVVTLKLPAQNEEILNELTFTFAENTENDKWLDGNASVNTGNSSQNG